MTFLTLLIVLLMERFWQTAAGLRQWRWLTGYSEWLATVTARTPFNKLPVAYALVVLSIVVVALIIQRLLLPLNYYTWYYLFNFVILFYCVGPDNFYKPFSSDAADASRVDKTASLNNGDLADDVTRANQSLFAPFFWFALLGVFGVVLYRVTERLPRNDFVRSALDVLEWIPARVLGFTFALVSYFVTVFPVCLKYVFSSPTENQTLLFETAKASLGEDQNVLHFIALIDRALIVWLVVLALIVLL